MILDNTFRHENMVITNYFDTRPTGTLPFFTSHFRLDHNYAEHVSDHELTIMNLLRARTDESQDVRFAVRERYPVEAAQQRPPTPSRDALKDIFGKLQ